MTKRHSDRSADAPASCSNPETITMSVAGVSNAGLASVLDPPSATESAEPANTADSRPVSPVTGLMPAVDCLLATAIRDMPNPIRREQEILKRYGSEERFREVCARMEAERGARKALLGSAPKRPRR